MLFERKSCGREVTVRCQLRRKEVIRFILSFVLYKRRLMSLMGGLVGHHPRRHELPVENIIFHSTFIWLLDIPLASSALPCEQMGSNYRTETESPLLYHPVVWSETLFSDNATRIQSKVVGKINVREHSKMPMRTASETQNNFSCNEVWGWKLSYLYYSLLE